MEEIKPVFTEEQVFEYVKKKKTSWHIFKLSVHGISDNRIKKVYFLNRGSSQSVTLLVETIIEDI